jgi:hypothetical protein
MSDIARRNAPRFAAPAAKGAWTPKGGRAKPVGELVPGLMRPAFEKFGFSAATLLTDWEAIAGRDVATFTAPERLKWPRQAGSTEAGEPGRGATLILRVAGARALEVEQMRDRLIERINAAFGYRAVSEVRVIQAPLPKRVQPSHQRIPADRAENPSLSNLADGPLKQAFARMATGIKLRREAKDAATA